MVRRLKKLVSWVGHGFTMAWTKVVVWAVLFYQKCITPFCGLYTADDGDE